jgi:hypothetical protein
MGSGSPFHCNYIPSTWSKKRVTHSISGQQWEFKKIIITIISMPMVILEWSTRRPLDIVTNGLVVIFVGGIWVGLDVFHSNPFEGVVIVE